MSSGSKEWDLKMADYNRPERESPLMEELDAIMEGKSKLDLAEEIWRMRRSGPNGDAKDTARYREMRRLLLGYGLSKYISSLPDEPITPEKFDAAMDASLKRHSATLGSMK